MYSVGGLHGRNIFEHKDITKIHGAWDNIFMVGLCGL